MDKQIQGDLHLRTTLPLDDSILKKVFENDKIELLLDFDKSGLDAKVFLRYILNIGIKTHIIPDSLSYENKSKLLLEYINDVAVRPHDQFVCVWKQVLLYSFGLFYDTNIFLTEDELKMFCESNKPLIEEIMTFLYSICFFQYYRIKLRIKEGKIENDMGLEISKSAPLNTISLINDPDISMAISEWLFANPGVEPKFYECFNGQKVGRSANDLAYHILNENNHLFLMVLAMAKAADKLEQEDGTDNLPDGEL